MKEVLCINGSVGGPSGNTGALLSVLEESLRAKGALLTRWDLAGWKTPFSREIQERLPELKAAQAVVFSTGTYWDSWGSLLQAFLEAATFLEGRPEVFGKPAGCLVSMHSVGGKEVLSRLQGVLSTLGFLIPPHSGAALSLAGQLALKQESAWSGDFWGPEDLGVVAHNLLAALGGGGYRAWDVDRADPARTWVDL